MRSEARRPIRPLVVVCLVLMLLTGGVSTLAAQGVIDPNADSDLDGTKNSMDPDDDNDGVYDDQDYYPLDPTRSQQETAATPTPVTVSPTPTPGPALPPTPTLAPVTNQKPDFDGDGNPDIVDPDDDNDGIMDEQDADLFNAAVGVVPTPSTIDPSTDNDADGIANSHDPDDDNDGVVDELDCAPFDPSIGTCSPEPTAPRTPGSGGGSHGSSPGGGGLGRNFEAGGSFDTRGNTGPGMLVTRLPSTGTGPELSSSWPLVLAAIAVAGMLMAGGMALRVRRR